MIARQLFSTVSNLCEVVAGDRFLCHFLFLLSLTPAATLDATDGDTRKVQKLSRHRNLNTLIIYDDNRGRDQQDVTEMLDSMF
jgi:integrase/recombinase XerC